jgi:hypothetical protein
MRTASPVRRSLRWSNPRLRYLYLAALGALVLAAVSLAMQPQAGPGGYEKRCEELCEPLPSRVEKKYLNPRSPKDGYRNMPRSVECICGSAVTGRSLL